jgi:hypothetical protein
VRSDHPAFLRGNSIFDYIKTPKAKIAQILSTAKTECNPIKFDFEVLYSGRYHPRTGSVYNGFDGLFFCLAFDRPTNIMPLSAAPENHFLVSPDGNILHCKFPEKTITSDPVGINIFDILVGRDAKNIKKLMVRSREKRLEIPVEYSIVIDGKSICEEGTIKPMGSSFLFRVRRIAGGLH